MNIYHLKYFVDAARFQSVSLSAKENLVSHSAVSQAIKSLEAHFEVNLVFHSKRRFQLTPEGELCFTEGQKIISQLADVKDHLQANRHIVRGTLNIWAPQSLIAESIYKSLALFQSKYPQVQVSIKPGAAALVRSAVLSGEAHLGIMIDDGHMDQFEHANIKTGDFILICKNKKTATLLNEKAEVIVTSREKIEVLHLKKNFKSKFKTELKIKMEVMSWGVIKNLVEKGFGIGYVPDYCVSHELAAGQLVKIETPKTAFKYQVAAIWAPNKQLHPNAKLFVDLLKQQANHV
jgi:DNA-binding transcriptional LysR family regulator